LIEHADEVRDRAALYLHLLNLEEEKKPSVSDLVFGDGMVDVTALENYLNENKGALVGSETALQIDLSVLKHVEEKVQPAHK